MSRKFHRSARPVAPAKAPKLARASRALSIALTASPAQLALLPSVEYACKSCGAKASVLLHRCPACRRFGTYGDAEASTEVGWHPESFAKISATRAIRKDLGHAVLNAFFGGGPVVGCAYEWSAPPGWGKSTLAMQFCGFFERPLYCSAEQTKGELKLYANRMRLPMTHAHCVHADDLDDVVDNATDEYDCIVVDSAQCFRTSEGGPAKTGSPEMSKAVIRLACDFARQLKMVCFIISHQNKDGEAAGELANQHLVTGVIHGEHPRGPKDPLRAMTMRKNRHGETPITVHCRMTAAGLDDFAIVGQGEHKASRVSGE